MGNLVFSLYELLGFPGLGPGRTELREAVADGTLAGAIRSYLPFLAAMGAVCGLLFIEAFRMTTGRRKNFCFASGLVIAGFGALLILAMIFQWPFWGRHLSPFFPVVVVVFALLLENILQRSPKAGTAGVFAVLGLLVISALNIRISERFAKDDYRSAYKIVRPMIEKGKIVWWAANTESAFYYGVLSSPLDALPDNMIPVSNQLPGKLEQFASPDAVVLSKTDLYDKEGAVRKYIKSNQLEPATCYSGIGIWR